LQLASRWRTTRMATESWASYVDTEDGLAWKSAFMLLRQLEPLFAAAVVRDPSLATTYPGLTRMFDAPKVIAKTGVATRKRSAKVKADNAAAAAVTSAVNAALAHAQEGGGAPATTTAAAAGAPATTVKG
jgi:hypothetical protein